MIVRILGEGQYDVADEHLEQLNQLDSALETAVEALDEVAFAQTLQALLAGVREVGVLHPADSLDESDLILPMDDATLDEVKGMLSDDGLIPG
ncbi:hypothetical protein [Nocardioides sp. 616]|uniref:PspA-associated protein PspAA n=1 Tax=Nocardioides sp. 616 TaxID=2268090 RepID=UPI000CE3BD3E|nr:hypothetical protein [Nocardioides sp. 616]